MQSGGVLFALRHWITEWWNRPVACLECGEEVPDRSFPYCSQDHYESYAVEHNP